MDGGRAAQQIIAADRVASKLDAALVFGATHVIDSAVRDIVDTVNELTEGRGADHVFVAAGVGSLIEIGSSILRRGGLSGKPWPRARLKRVGLG